MKRTLALLDKELADLRKNPALFVPAILAALFSIALPFLVAIAIPHFAGERLADSSDFEVAAKLYRDQPATRLLDPEAAIQTWIFQQFLVLLVLAPVAGSMSAAAHSVVGEKLARTLEPLLATPLSTFELLSAKILGALIPALALTFGAFALYCAGIALFALPGVLRAFITPSAIAVVFGLGSLAALAALQLAVCVSSRANDARSAQQIGALIILPIAGLLVAQLMGSFQLTLPVISAIAGVLAGINVGLMRLGIALFDRESILTRWK